MVEPEIPSANKNNGVPITIFSAPRKFDLATMLAVTTAYALMFAGMRAADAPHEVMFWTGIFFSAVAAAQALLFQGASPRLSSVLVGTFFFVAATIVRWEFAIISLLPAILMGATMGAPFGYLAGTLVGGVFLIAHHLRQKFNI